MSQDYYNTKETAEEYIRLAKDVNGLELIEKLKTVLPAHSTLLELGSGPGTDWRILKDHFDVIGSDNSHEFLKHLRSTNPSGRFLELDAVSLNTSEIFDGIFSNKVLHHLNDQELANSISRQHDILEPKGVICHSFWKGEGEEVFNGLFVNYHTEKELRMLFKKHFHIHLIEEYAEFEEGDSLVIIAEKKIGRA